MVLLGRDAERERIERFLSGPRPAALIVEGEAGIGKTTLWRHGIEAAVARGGRVLELRTAEAERSLTFAGLAGLLPDELLGDVLPEIPEPRRAALETALLRAGRGRQATDARTVGLGVLSVLSLLAARSPLVVAIDDLPWIDEPTLRALDFALRRMEGSDVALLATRRPEERVGIPLEAAFREGRRERLAVEPLSVGAIGRLVRDRLDVSLPRLVGTRLHRESGGNPFVALELARAAQARGAMPGPGVSFPVPADVAALVDDRLAPLSADALDALLIVAALGRSSLDLVTRIVGDAVADGAIEELHRADLVRLEEPEVRTSHPLVASAALAGVLPARRRRLHRRIAAVVDDVEERARHLALGADGPNEQVAAALDAAAALAGRRGASEAAADLAQMAAGLTPPDDRQAVAVRQLAVAEHRLGAGGPAEAREAAERALELLPPGPARVDTLILLGMIAGVLRGEVAAAARLFAQALEEAEGDRDALVRAHLGAGHWADELGDADGAGEAEHARAALELLEGDEEQSREAASKALLMLVEADFRGGRPLDVERLDRAIELEQGTDIPFSARPSTQGATGIGLAGMHRASIEALRAVLARAEREGDWPYRPTQLRALGWIQWCVGDLAAAAESLRAAIELADELGVVEGAGWATLGQVLGAMGEPGDGRRWCELARERSKETGYWWWEYRAYAGITFIELTEGNRDAAAEAATRLLEVGEGLVNYQPGWQRVHGDAIEALLGVGRRDEADDVTTWFEDRAATSEHPWSSMVSARCRALLQAGEGRVEEALASYDRSLAADAAGEMRFERARTLLARGEFLRRVNRRRDARADLLAARELFEGCESPPWTTRAARELGAVSGRAATPTELTSMERRVVELAVAGRSNREIAAELFLSVRTIESHLSSAYRKLGVKRRADLAGALERSEP